MYNCENLSLLPADQLPADQLPPDQLPADQLTEKKMIGMTHRYQSLVRLGGSVIRLNDKNHFRFSPVILFLSGEASGAKREEN